MALTAIDKNMLELQEFFIHCKKFQINIEAVENSENTIQEWFLSLAPHEKFITGHNLLFALSTILLNESYPPNIKIKAMECLRAIIEVVKIRQSNIFRELYTINCTQIFNPKSISLGLSHSEELKEAVLITLTCIFKNIEKESFSEIFNSDMVKVISVGIVLAISILKLEKSVKTRCLALQFILTVAHHNTRDSNILNMVSLVFINFIPGMMMPFTDIICKELTVHHSILQLTVRAWGLVLFLAFSDLPHEKTPVSDNAIVESWMASSLKNPNSDPKDLLEVFLVPQRTIKWTQAALEVLKPLIKQVAEKHNVLHESARCEMITAFYVLLSECSDSLGKAAGPLLDALVGLSMDESPRISEKAHQALMLLFKNSVHVMDLADNQLPEIQINLNRGGDSDKIVRILPIINGYFRIITLNSKESPCLISNPLLLPTFLSALKNMCCVNCNSQLTHESSGHPTALPKTYVTWQTLLVALDKKTLIHFEDICKYICEGSMESATCLLMDEYNSKKSIECLIFLNLILSNCTKAHESLSKQFMDFYLEIENNLDFYSETTPKQLQNKVLRIMLSLEGLSHLAALFQENYEQYLLKTLYYVVEKIGSTFTSVRAAAITSSLKITEVLKFKSQHHLIEENIDYLSYHICVKLRKNYEVPVLDAIRVTAQLCPKQTLKEIEHILQQLLSKGTNEYSAHVTFHLGLFKAFVGCAKIASNIKIFEESSHDNSSRTNREKIVENNVNDSDSDVENEVNLEPDPLESHNKNVGVMLTNYIKKREIERLESEREACDTGIPSDEEASNKPEDVKPELPAYASIAIQIVNRCMNYLPSCTTMQKALCLEIMDTGLKVIAEFEDELLPIVHEVWSPLILRFHSGALPLIMHRSFQLLCTLASLAKDFIRFRTVREALPILRDFLIKSSLNSNKPNAFCQSYKLQKKLLSELAHLVCNLNLRERETSMVVEAAESYLGQNKHGTLAKKAIRLIMDLMNHDPYFIAYVLKLRRLKQRPV